MKELAIATRKSQLALWQNEFIAGFLNKTHGIAVRLEGFKTRGDVLLNSPLAKVGGKGLFTKELEESMLGDEAHLAVHNSKDVSSFFPQGLVLAAVSKRERGNDAMLSQNYKDSLSLPKGAKIGTTSLGRKMQLLLLKPDLEIISLRGNVNSRVKKLKNGDFDAIILAMAGIKRLDLDKQVDFVYTFSKDELIPAASQGALGIGSTDDEKFLKFSKCLNDDNALIETTIEREFISTLEGGCQAPIGTNARLLGDEICVRAILGPSDSSEILKEKRMIRKSNFKGFGESLAKELIAKGAKELLKKAESMM